MLPLKHFIFFLSFVFSSTSLLGSEAAKIKSVEELYIEAKESENKDQLKKALTLYKKCAKSGHPKAIHDLAWFYLEGEEGLVEQNEGKGFLLLVKSANLGFPKAMTALAILYKRKGDEKSSTYWQHKATLLDPSHDKEEREIVATARKIIFGELEEWIATSYGIVVPGLTITPIMIDAKKSEGFITKETQFKCRLDQFGKVIP